MLKIKQLLFFSVLAIYSQSIWGQLVVDSKKASKVVIPPPENKGPSLLQPKKKKARNGIQIFVLSCFVMIFQVSAWILFN